MTIPFVLKKLAACALMPPGLLIILCLLVALFVKKRIKLVLIIFALFIYALSVDPVADTLLAPLEKAYPIPSINEIRQCDAYVILGGGSNENAPTIDGKGMLDGDSLLRVMAGYRLYLIFQKPIIISGGNAKGAKPEAEISRRFLMNLGVSERHIIAESKSADTHDNARFTKEICEKNNFRHILLITSAYHMTRSVMLFNKHFIQVTPYPAGFRSQNQEKRNIYDFLPEGGNMLDIGIAVKEYMGILFYKITL